MKKIFLIVTTMIIAGIFMISCTAQSEITRHEAVSARLNLQYVLCETTRWYVSESNETIVFSKEDGEGLFYYFDGNEEEITGKFSVEGMVEVGTNELFDSNGELAISLEGKDFICTWNENISDLYDWFYDTNTQTLYLLGYELRKSPGQQKTDIIESQADTEEILPNVDLAIYDSYGEWSNDRIWVHKTDESWDYSEGYYGYLDQDGELVGEWHSDEEWLTPQDFVLDYAIIHIDSYKDKETYLSKAVYGDIYEMIDKTGKTVYTFEAFPLVDPWSPGARTILHNFNTSGLLFYSEPRGENQEDIFHIILETGEDILIKDSSNYKMGLEYFDTQFVNGYITHGAGAWDHLYIDREGNIVLDLTEFEYSIQELFPITDGVARVVFSGEDGQDYIVSVDLDGNWLTTPVAY